MKKIGLWIVILALIFPTFSSLLRPGFYNIQDAMQPFWVYQMTRCVQDGQLPCRWVPDSGYQYGYPLFNYYSPGPYYVGALLHFANISYADVVKILFAGGFIFSAIFMYRFLLSFHGHKFASLVGAILYIYLPVRAVEVYVRGSLGEFLALAISPLLFWTLHRLIENPKKTNFVFFSLSLSALFLTHALSSLIFLPILALWTVILVFTKKAWPVIPNIVGAILLGFGLSAFFTLPVTFERQFVHIETLTGGYFDYRQHFVNWPQLFISNVFDYGSSQLGPNDNLSLSAGQIHSVLLFAAIVYGLIFIKKHRTISTIILSFSAIDLIYLFLTHSRSSFIWQAFPQIAVLQFPWRLLPAIGFLSSFIGSIFIAQLPKKISILVGVAAISGVIILHGSFFQPQKWFDFPDSSVTSGAYFEFQLTASIFDYLPKSAVLPPNQKAQTVPEILSGTAEIINYQKATNRQFGKVKVLSPQATLRLPIYDFPGMQVLVDSSEIDHDHSNCQKQPYCFGLINFTVSQGIHDIEVKLTDTPIRILGNELSFFSLISAIVLLII